jgi:hypothetical protein
VFEDRHLSWPFTGSNPQWHQGRIGLWFRFSILITAALENGRHENGSGRGGFTFY